MGTIKYILWDIDGTLVDFDSAEVEGLKICFNKYNLVELTKEIIDNFKVFNDKYWNKYEKGQIPKKEAMEKRFIDLFKFIFPIGGECEIESSDRPRIMVHSKK